MVLVSMGSLLGTMREAVDRLCDEGLKVGLLKIRCFRPSPRTRYTMPSAPARW